MPEVPDAQSIAIPRRTLRISAFSSAGVRRRSRGGTVHAVPCADSGPGGWSLVFADEFDAAGAVDPAKWGYELGYIRNNEKQYHTSRAENVRAEGGNLVIEGRKEAYQGYGYTSASINTRGRFEFLYGRVEVRAKLPTGSRYLAGRLDAGHQHRPGRVADLRRDRHHGERRLRPAAHPRQRSHGRL